MNAYIMIRLTHVLTLSSPAISVGSVDASTSPADLKPSRPQASNTDMISCAVGCFARRLGARPRHSMDIIQS